MKIFLDDVRDPIDCAKYMHKRIGKDNFIYLEKDWVIVKNYYEFMTTINQAMQDNVKITHISFDHDLADEHYDPSMMVSDEDYNALYETFEERTGYDCAKWLKEWYKEYNLELPIMYVHSMNPIGTQNIINVFK